MSTVFDRLREELDQLGDAVNRNLEQGRLQIQKSRVKHKRDEAAQELGLLVYQKLRDQSIDEARYDHLLTRLDQYQDELAKIDREISAVKGEDVSVGQDPPPPSEPVEAEVKGEDEGTKGRAGEAAG